MVQKVDFLAIGLLCIWGPNDAIEQEPNAFLLTGLIGYNCRSKLVKGQQVRALALQCFLNPLHKQS